MLTYNINVGYTWIYGLNGVFRKIFGPISVTIVQHTCIYILMRFNGVIKVAYGVN